ncbi:MAG: hypothetical protein L0216_03575 [Planctomycetales bacterium]|nr:hypothetical protein [Planctomycetales bacterium]
MRRTWLGLVAAAGILAGCEAPTYVGGRTAWFRLTARDYLEAEHAAYSTYLRDLGETYLAEEDFPSALPPLESARQLQYGADFQTQLDLGRIYERDGDYRKAVAAYSTAAYLRPDHVGGWFNLRRVVPRIPIMRGGTVEGGGGPAAGEKKEAAGG